MVEQTGELESLRQKLLTRIHRHYHTRHQAVHIGPIHLDFVRIEDPDRVLDKVAAEQDLRERLAGGPVNVPVEQLHLPYWSELWESALGLGEHLVHQAQTSGADAAQPMAGRVVLDLGCGMGLSGTVAAALGADVTFADLEAPALLFAALNSLPFRDRVRTRRLNWQIDRLPERFDLIIGADILYERSQWEFLDFFWRHHLAAGGQVLLGEPGRQTGEKFLDWIKSRPWNLTMSHRTVPTRPVPIRIMTLMAK
jgi:predicted nicotinamide N-methyase